MRSIAPDTEVWIILVPSSKFRIKIMLDQENDPDLDYGWLTADECLTRFSKAREQIVGRIKGAESPSVQGPQSSEEDLVLREMYTSSNDSPIVREPGTMRPLVKHITAVPVPTEKKSQSQWTI